MSALITCNANLWRLNPPVPGIDPLTQPGWPSALIVVCAIVRPMLDLWGLWLVLALGDPMIIMVILMDGWIRRPSPTQSHRGQGNMYIWSGIRQQV